MSVLDRVQALAPYPSPDTPIGACVRNVLAKLATVPSDVPLLARVELVMVMQEERIYVRVDPAFLTTLEVCHATFASEGRPHSKEHQHLIDWLGMVNPGIRYTLVSFRERVTFNSLQCVVAVSDRGDGPEYADCDIDLGGALTDVVGFLRHQEELLKGGVTDHLALRQTFLADPVLGPLVA